MATSYIPPPIIIEQRSAERKIAEKAMILTWKWTDRVDRRVPGSSRWHSGNSGLVRTQDALGDHLIRELREAARAAEDDTVLCRFGDDLMQKLESYEDESRLLVKLANTGYVVQLLQRATDSALGILSLLGTPARDSWHQDLRCERDERTAFYENLLLKSDEWMAAEMGDEGQQLEVLTVLKHGFDQYEGLLNPREMDVMSAVYDTLARQSNVVVGVLPDWFTDSQRKWGYHSEKSMVDGEEACIHQSVAWAELNHPNVRKIYGACHVGKPFIVCEWSLPLDTWAMSWKHVLDCALGIEYVHDRGFVHQNLSIANLLYSQISRKGFLSGMGLVARRRVSTSSDERGLSVSADILAFGLAIFELLTKQSKRGGSESSLSSTEDISTQLINENLPEARPDFAQEAEWKMLLGMCAADPMERASMADVLHQLGVLANQDAAFSTTEDADVSAITGGDVSEYEIQTLGQTIEATLDEVDELCIEAEDLSAVNRPVYARLLDVYEQLQATPAPLPVSLVESFSSILLRFFNMLEQQADQRLFGGSVVESMCAAGSIAGKNYSIHHDIDRLLLSWSGFNRGAEVHCWKPTWKMIRQRQRSAMKECLEDPSTLLKQIESERERAKAMALLEFERRSHESVYSPTVAEENQLGSEGATTLPPWFIPPHQVELGKHLADGSFGAVYIGKWLGTDVVVKQVLTDQQDRENREQFRREVDLWFTLNHANLIKLYGACHEGRPFFVCERANRGTLVSDLKISRRGIWGRLYDASLGLQHLHERNIVHGDLKGNNILCCDGNQIKLADFGLSSVANGMMASAGGDEGALGAFRWKAPECLLGSRATFASDIYSFAMCIIEALTGQFPWGNSIPDEVVAFNVTRQKLIPPRPDSFSDDEWELVTGMCSFNPQHRISVGAVASCAWNFSISL